MNSLLIKGFGALILSSLFVAGAVNNGLDIVGLQDDYHLDPETDPEILGFGEDGYKDPNLTEEEVYEIAISNEEVAWYVESTNAEKDIYYDGYGLWVASFFPTYETIDESDFDDPTTEDVKIDYLDVYIDDENKQIIDLYYGYEDWDYYYEDPLLTEAVIAHMQEADLTRNFIDSHNDLEWFVSAYDASWINVWVYDTMDDVWLSADMEGEAIGEDTWEFTFHGISANAIFGNPNLSFENALDVALSNEEVSDWTSSNSEYTVSTVLAYYNYEAYGADEYDKDEEYFRDTGYYYTIDFNTYFEEKEYNESDPDGYWNNNWMVVTIDDATGEIIEVWATKLASLTEAEVITIAIGIDEISTWLANITKYDIYAWYDGFGFWYVDIYADWDYAQVTINDATAMVEDYYLFITQPANLTEQEIIDIVLADDEVKAWLSNVTEYDVYAWYNGYGSWHVDIYDISVYYNYVFAEVDDSTGEIIWLEVYLAEPANLSLEEVTTIAMNAGLFDFLAEYPEAETSIQYDGFGMWYVNAWHPVFLDAWLWMEIDDVTGEVLYSESNNLAEMPVMTSEEVWALVKATSNYTEFIVGLDDIYESIMYFDGFWYVYVNGASNDEYKGLSFVIDDAEGEIIEISSDCWCEGPEIYK